MQKKIYSLMYVCVLDNLNSIGQNGSQATTWVLREWLFSSKRYKNEKCQLHWLYLRRGDLSKKTSNVRYIALKPDTCILWGGNEPFCRLQQSTWRYSTWQTHSRKPYFWLNYGNEQNLYSSFLTLVVSLQEPSCQSQGHLPEWHYKSSHQLFS